ncbi:serine hydrolase domain-containing protein [Bacillus sonorensis]|nr:serine hydrolase domain-containing protein [Bacillus sonorensis]
MKNPKTEWKGFRDFVLQQMNEWKVPGAAIAVVAEDEVIMAEGFGFKDKERKCKVNPETVFAIGSATKAFTTAGMALWPMKEKWSGISLSGSICRNLSCTIRLRPNG